MPDTQKGIDFEQLIEQLSEALVEETDLPTVWGGEFLAERLGEFLTAWSLPRDDMPWCLWEQVDQIVLEKKTFPNDLELLEYGRVFGEGGDLSLSRDGGRFLWHFVGKKDAVNPAGFEFADDFWTQQKHLRFRQWEETALLWGEKHETENRWVDDRVARAKLIYPEMQSLCKGSRVEIYYRIYTSSGQIQLVWLLGLRRHHENREN